jgi:predicted glycosyltransferase involved in capsule biosynthesis
MKLGIVVPWRARPTRVKAFGLAVNRLMDQFPNSTVYYADKEDEIFNVSGSRNQGCLSAIKDGCDMLLVVDADTLLDKKSIKNAIVEATKNNCVCMPFMFYNPASEKVSTSLINGEIPFEKVAVRSDESAWNHPGGAYVMSSSTFLLLNGWDERFVGWGYEDDAFAEAHKRVLGRGFMRVEGYAVAMFHQDRDQEYIDINSKRYRTYVDSSNEQVLEIIQGNMDVE